MKKALVLLALSSFLLASCGGSSDGGSDNGSDDGKGDNAEIEQVKSTGVLAIPVVISASSSDPNQIMIDWKPSQSSSNTDSSVEYTVHVKQGTEDFVPTSSTVHQTNVTKLELPITGLEKETAYSIKVVAKRGSEQSTSEVFQAKTASVKAVPKAGVTFHYQRDLYTDITDLKIDNGAKLHIHADDDINAGDVLFDQYTGYLIVVKSIDENKVATIRFGGINDIYDDLSVGTSIKVSE